MTAHIAGHDHNCLTSGLSGREVITGHCGYLDGAPLNAMLAAGETHQQPIKRFLCVLALSTVGSSAVAQGTAFVMPMPIQRSCTSKRRSNFALVRTGRERHASSTAVLGRRTAR